MVWQEPVSFYDSVAVYFESGEYVVHNYEAHSWVVLDREKYGWLSQMQYGGQTPAEVMAAYQAASGVSESEARQAVGRLLLLLWANRIARHPSHKPLPAPGLPPRSVPKIVYFVATYRCNLTCAYCYAESSPQVDTKGDLTTAEAMAMIDQVADLGIGAMAFTGGEALLRPDCVELVEYAHGRGLKTFLITNGAPVTKAKAERLAKVLTQVTVSMDSPTAEGGHDAMRGSGSWGWANQAIEWFQEAGLPVAINTTITASSVDQLPEMAEWALDRGITQHRIGYVSDLGRGGTVSLSATPLERLEAERELLQVMLDNIDRVDLDGLKYLQTPPPPFILKLHCGVGLEEISIDSHGDVYPCKLLHLPHLKAGNLREQSLKEIWETSEILGAMVDVNPNQLPGCEPCTFRYVCGGGCRAHQMAMTGDLLGTYNGDCPSLRRSFRRQMWLHYKQHEARLGGGEAHAHKALR